MNAPAPQGIGLTPPSFVKHPKLVAWVAEMVASGQMPPPEARQPTATERESLHAWLRAFLAAEARAHAGDPGRVVLRPAVPRR